MFLNSLIYSAIMWQTGGVTFYYIKIMILIPDQVSNPADVMGWEREWSLLQKKSIHIF